jgi:hypothetical protein
VNAGAAAIPTSLKAPGSLSAGVTSQYAYETNLYFSVDSALIKFVDADQTDHDALGIDSIGHTAQIDWKLNNGPWHYTKDWDDKSAEYGADSGIYADTGYIDGETNQTKTIFDLRNGDSGLTPLQKMLGSAMIKGSDANGETNRLDLANNTFSFRVRVLISYFVKGSDETKFIISPWSQVLTYGKGGVSLAKPTKLDKPTISDPVVGKNNDGSPKITFTAVTPKQVQDADNYIKTKDSGSVEVEHQMNINNSGWIEAQAGKWWLSDEIKSVDVPTTYDNGKIMKINEAYIQLRMRYKYAGSAQIGSLKSEWSDVISVNTPGWSKASSWATEELQAADDSGLIPDILKGADMTKPISREEFAELAVLLYEKAANKTAAPVSPNPFKDTKNPRVLKAFTLKITTGTSATTFEPKTLIPREQCAAMLFRTIKAIAPNGSYSITGVKDFPDQKLISKWAVDATKYMSKLGIIKGDAKGNFVPKATTTVQQAKGYGMATREAAIMMAVRAYNKLK